MPNGRNPIDIEIGRRIRKRRTDLGMTRRDLAERLGTDVRHMQDYETGEDRVCAFDLMVICQVLRLGVDEMFSPPPDRRGPRRH